MPLTLLLGTLIVLATLLVYAYLPLRDWAGARWVYGNPGTWEGFWHEFLGREARREMIPPVSLADFWTHVVFINRGISYPVNLAWIGDRVYRIDRTVCPG